MRADDVRKPAAEVQHTISLDRHRFGANITRNVLDWGDLIDFSAFVSRRHLTQSFRLGTCSRPEASVYGSQNC
jgi:hypothetical protein